jgi:hypothetical protein
MAEGMGEAMEREPVELGRELQAAADPGFFEHRTQAILSGRFRARGFRVEEFPGMTGLPGTNGLLHETGFKVTDERLLPDLAAYGCRYCSGVPMKEESFRSLG